MDNLKVAYEAFNLNEMPWTWVDVVFNGFAKFREFPTEYEIFLDEDMWPKIENFCDCFNLWFANDNVSLSSVLNQYTSRKDEEDGNKSENDTQKPIGSNTDASHLNEDENIYEKFSWRTLVQEQFEYKKLTSLFGTLILYDEFHKNDAKVFETSLQSSIAYLYLVTLPDSHLYDIFKPVLYSHILSLMGACCAIVNFKKIKEGPRKRKQADDPDAILNYGEHEELIKEFAHRHEPIIKYMNELLEALTLLFKNNHVTYDEDIAELTVNALINLCVLEDKTNIFDRNIEDFLPKSFSYLSRNGYNALLEFYRRNNSIIDLVGRELGLKLMFVEPNNLSVPTNVTVESKMNIVRFISNVVNEFRENCYETIRKIVQVLCYVIPDKAELRTKTKSIIIPLLLVSPEQLRRDEILDILILNSNCDAKVRLFTTDIISDLLLERDYAQFPVNAVFTDHTSSIYNYEFLLATMFCVCYDVSINVKCKALSCIDKLLDRISNNTNPDVEMKELFRKFINGTDENLPTDVTLMFNTHQYVGNKRENLDNINFIPDFRFIMNMLHCYSRQRNVILRRHALQILTKICIFDKTWMDEVILNELAHACIDSSIVLRRCGSKLLTALLFSAPTEDLFVKHWVQAVLPLVLEEQAKYRTEFLTEIIYKVLFGYITRYEDLSSHITKIPWLLLHEINRQNKHLLLNMVVSESDKIHPFSDKDVEVVATHIGTTNDVSAWCVLTCISKLGKIKNAKFIYDSFEVVSNNLGNMSHSWLIMETLVWTCTTLNEEDQRALLHQLKTGLLNNTIPRRLITSAHDICVKLVTDSYSEQIQQTDAYIKWSETFLKVTEECVLKNIDINMYKIDEIDDLINRIILLGEIAQVNPKRINPIVCDYLETILTTPSKFPISKMNEIELLRPATLLMLMKCYLFNERRLQKILPDLKLLLQSKHVLHTTKQNIIMMLADLCIRFTDTIEPYLGCICMCFSSPDSDLRLTAVESITEKIRETYIKPKSWIVYPLIAAALDVHPAVRYIINSFLTWESKVIIEKYFSGLICFANNYAPTGMHKLNKTLRSFVAVKDATRRQHLYTIILEKANLLQRITIWRKLSCDIIAKFNEGTIPLNDRTIHVLQDVFFVLTENEIVYHTKMNQRRNVNMDDDLHEELQAAEGQDEITDAHKATLKINKTEAAREVVAGVLKIRKFIKENGDDDVLRKPCLRYIIELMKNFDENSQEMEPLIGDNSLLEDLQVYRLEREAR